jgi:glycerophosphoryl diester phosphodiesterase
MWAMICVGLLAMLAAGDERTAPGPVPLIHVHAHNDYEHTHPLFDALACGICSVEADIHLVDGKLLVAHSRSQVKPDRTLQSLYLDPLRQRVRDNGGRVYRNGPTVVLLIDFKNDPEKMYPVLRDVLRQYADILTTWEDKKEKPGAVKAIMTGDHPTVDVLSAEKTRYAALDGTLEALESNPPASLVPWMSSEWGKTFRWRGKDEFPAAEQRKLHQIVEKAHAQHRQVRFWGAPDNVQTWKVLRAAGVDLINTDDLRGAQRFLLEEDTDRPAR